MRPSQDEYGQRYSRPFAGQVTAEGITVPSGTSMGNRVGGAWKWERPLPNTPSTNAGSHIFPSHSKHRFPSSTR